MRDPLLAFYYYDDILHGREMSFKPEELKSIVIKSLRANKIIKEKEVNVYDFKEYESKYEYNKHTKEEFQELTQEEYDLLKEVLSNEA